MPIRSKRSLAIVPAVLFAALTGCGGGAPPASPPTDNGLPTNPAPTGVVDMPDATAAAAPIPESPDAGATTSTPPPPAPLTDAQIATIVAAANDGEIAQAQDALKKVKNRKVMAFARHMVTDHGQAGKDLGAIQKKGSLDPAPTDTSRQLDTDGKAVLSTLQSVKDTGDYERQYMDAQVSEHQQLLDALDTKLIAGAQNADLKTFLQKVREKVAEHFRMAKEIRTSLK